MILEHIAVRRNFRLQSERKGVSDDDVRFIGLDVKAPSSS